MLFRSATVNINNNTFSGITSNGYAPDLYAILSSVTTTVNFNAGNNTFSGLTLTGASSIYNGNTIHAEMIGCAGQNVNCHDNLIDNITLNGWCATTYCYGIHCYNSSSSNETYTGNTIRNFNTSNYNIAHGNSDMIKTGTAGTIIVQNNQIYNIQAGTSGSVNTGINGMGQIVGNQVYDLHLDMVENFQAVGCYYGILESGNTTITGNQLYNIWISTSAEAGNIMGIKATGNFTTTISKNSISNLYNTVTGLGTATGTVDGMNLAGGTKYVYNNFIFDLKAQNANLANAVTGINISASGTPDIYYNTVFLNTNSTGATFGTSAIYVNTAATVEMKNNNFINLSIPNGGGYTCACRRSSTTLTSYSAGSNNNNFYAGTPGLYRLIYYDDTNSDQTLAAYKTRVAPRDANSITENTPFVNTSTEPYDIHISPTIPTQCESAGIRITSPVAIGDDYDGNIRQGEVGYTGTGSAQIGRAHV